MAERVVIFDTNTLIPLILPASRSTRLFRRIKATGFVIAATPQLLTEVQQTLRTKKRLRKWLGLTDSEIQ